MSVYPDSVCIEMQLAGTAGTWTNVTEDVIRSTPITCSYGIKDNTPLGRVASTGMLNFSMDNSTNNSAGLVGYYSPGHINCRSGFAAGITVRLGIYYDGTCYPKFYGRIPVGGIKIIPGANKERQTLVEVRDFMEQCAIHDIETPDFAENKTAAEVAALVLANQRIQPLSTEYNTCAETFTTVFSTTKSKTKSITEIYNSIISELGYAYVKHDLNNYEIFTIEGRNTRTTKSPSKIIITPVSVAGYLLKEDGFKFQLEDESGYIKLDESQTITYSFQDQQISADIQNGNNLYNYIQGISYPREVGTAAEVLFKLNSPFILPSGQSITFKGTFTDPNNLSSNISAKSILAPVGTTDYLMNSNSTGTGSNLTANLNVGTPEYGTNEIIYTLQNTGISNGYITKLQARGTAIRAYDPVISFSQGSVSIDTHGKYVLDLDLQYQDDPTISNAYITTLLNQYQNPVTRCEYLKLCANTDNDRMQAFLYMDIGDRFTLAETISGVDGDYFINGVDFEIYANNNIFYSWNIKSSSYDAFAFWYLGVVGQSELGVTTIVGF
jgi:hypothetical protein